MTQSSSDMLERAHTFAVARDSSVKSILLHVQSDATVARRLETALSLARASGAHLQCVHVTPIEAYVAFDGFGGVFVMNDVIKALDEQEARLRERVEAELAREDVPWDYEQVTGHTVSSVAAFAALNDLVVVGREPHDSKVHLSQAGTLGEILQRSRTPLFVDSDDGGQVDLFGPAVIAWDGSYEAANAVRASIGLLKLASRVEIVRVSEEKEEQFPNSRLLRYLSRHDLHAELREESARDSSGEAVAGRLVECAVDRGAAYIVMGGYGHSRLGEYLFGGVTRSLFARCPVPLVVAH